MGQNDLDFEEVVSRFGEWTSFNVEFAPGQFTMRKPAGTDWPIRRATFFGFWAENTLNKPISQMRVLDLGCLEGSICYHLARMGAEAIGLEAREMNLAKCEFVKRASGMKNISFVQGDMLDMQDMGEFDLIICSGVLYHVDAPDILPFLSDLRRRSAKGCVVIDTHFSSQALEYFDASVSLRVFGRSITEHSTGDGNDKKDTKAWASFRNNHSFWPTKRSLVNLLGEAGFGAVNEPLMPQNEWGWKDRTILIADSRKPRFECSYPLNPYLDPDPRPEAHHQFHHQHQMKPKNPATIDLYAASPAFSKSE